MNIHKSLAAAALLALSAGAAQAHHSFAMFDRDRTVTLVGTVKDFQWTSPHTWIQLDVTDEQGVLHEWSIEALSTGTLSRQGWKPGSFKAGDKVTVKVFPMKDGSNGGSFVGAVTADGQQLGHMD